MSDNSPLTQREFERWCVDDRGFKERILDHIEEQQKVNTTHTRKIAVLETKHARTLKTSVSAVVVAVLTGLSAIVSAWLGGK